MHINDGTQFQIQSLISVFKVAQNQVTFERPQSQTMEVLQRHWEETQGSLYPHPLHSHSQEGHTHSVTFDYYETDESKTFNGKTWR